MNQQAIKQCKSILKKNHLHPLRKLGKGAFATVFLVEKIQLQKNQNQLYSVKCINKKQIVKRPSLNKYIKQQIQILRNIEHENIVKSFRTFQDQGWIFMVMEYCDKGNLNTKVTESQGGVLNLDQAFYLTADVIKGLQYMHSKNLIHRDIKAQNILLTSRKQRKSLKSKKTLTPPCSSTSIPPHLYQYVTKICDLGFARQQDQTVNTFCGTTCYMAPQIFQKTNYDNKVDIWALGVLVFYMLFGEFPFKSLNVQFQIQKKCTDGFKIGNVVPLKANESISKQDLKLLDDFFRKIFIVNPQQRMGLQQIKTYPWLKKYFMVQKQLPSLTKFSQKVLSNPRLLQYKSLQKTTIESDSSSSEHAQSVTNAFTNNLLPKQKNIEIEKYLFLKEIIEEVQKQKFLKSSQEVAFKYYMLKMLHCEFAKVLEKTGKGEYKKDLEALTISLEKYTNVFKSNIQKISIPKFQPQLFNPKAKSFSEIKQPYRLVIGHVFAKAHKNITEDIHIRSQLKLKLFICHVINRVFNEEHNEGIFVHFDSFSKKLSPIKGLMKRQWSFREFRKWIQSQEPQKLVQTVQLMNAKFYKGK